MAIDKIREMAVELIGRDVVEDVELDEGRKRGYEKSPYEVHTFRLSMGDKKQELLMALLQRGGKKGTPSKGKINDFVYRIPAVDAKKFPGLYAYRYTDKWQNFGPGSMEGIEYMIVSKGTRGKSSGVSVVKYKGSYTVYTPHGQTEVPVKGEVRINKELTADAIVDAIGDDIQYVVDDYMDKNSDVFPEDVELDEGSGALPSESELLSYLKGGKKISVAELAYSFGITPQKATKFVRSLVAKGTLATVKPSEGRVRTSREAVYTLAEDVYLDEANTLPGREKAVSLLTGKASDIERELRTVPWMTKLKPGAFKTLVKESLRDPLVFAVLKTRDDGEYLNKLKTLRSVRGGKTATRIETMIKLAKDKFMNESSKGSTGYSVRKLFDLLLRAVSESNMKMIEMWKKELEDKGADRHAIDLVIRNEKLPAIVKRMKEDVELDEEKRTGKDALANVEMNDFPYSLIVRAVKKKKEWDHDDLKLDLFDVIRAQYYKKYKPHFGKGASDQRLRYVADQFIMRLQRDGKLDHVGMRARDGGVEKTGYGQFVYAVEDVELDESKLGYNIGGVLKVLDQVKFIDGDQEETAISVAKALLRVPKVRSDYFHFNPISKRPYRTEINALKNILSFVLEKWLIKLDGLDAFDFDDFVEDVLSMLTPTWTKQSLEKAKKAKQNESRVRPGPHWNPWPTKNTTLKELIDGLEGVANSAARDPHKFGFTQEQIDVTSTLAWAMKKGDKNHVRKLLKVHGDKVIGGINEVFMWLNGQIEDVELDEASGSKLAMLKLEWAKLGTKALKAFPSSPVQKEIEEKQRDVENKIDKIQGKGGSYYPETWFKEDVELDEAIPQSEIKNGEVYRKRSNVDPGAGASKYGLDSSNLIGWFANKYNMSVGWTIFDTTPSEKSEFGKDALRTYSEKTKTTSIAKFNLKKGTYAFLDNKAYEDGEIKYDRLSAYNRVRVVDTPKAFKAFGLSKSNVEDVELDEVSGVRSMRDELLHEGGRQTMDDKEFNELGEGVTDKMHQPYVDWMNSSKAKKTAEDAARAAGFSISKSKMKFRLVASSQRGAVLAVSEWREGDKFIRITLGYHPMSGDHTVTVMVGTYDKNKSSFTSTSVRKAELDLSKATLTYKKEVKEDVDLNEGFNYIKDELSKLNSGTTLFDVQITDQLGNKTKVMTLDKELIVGVDKLLGGKKLGKSYRESEIGKLDKESDFLNIKITDYEGKSTKWLKLDKKSWKYISKLKLYKSEDVGMPLSNEVLESVRNIRNTLLG